MSQYTRRFVISGLLFLFISGLFGLSMAAHPHLRLLLRFSHIHMMMIGWVSMLIFGLGYHVIPRFCMSRLVPDHWQMLHWWLANVGLAGMVVIPIVQFEAPQHIESWQTLFLIFGIMQFMGILIFVLNMLRVLQILPAPKMKISPCCSKEQCE